MFCVYILFSGKLNRYYTGSTDDIERRIIQHNSASFEDAFTKKGIPWKIVLVIEGLESAQAFNIEKHIKKMKSAKYIQNLIHYPDMRIKLIERFR